jgi:periplasmic divalent cation tolerance protein
MTAVFVYVTAGSEAEAAAIARAVVAERLAACANILPIIRSVYWWQGAVQESAEAALILKTTAAQVGALTARIRAMHSYDCPCIVVLPISGGNSDFLAWIAQETGAGG